MDQQNPENSIYTTGTPRRRKAVLFTIWVMSVVVLAIMSVTVMDIMTWSELVELSLTLMYATVAGIAAVGWVWISAKVTLEALHHAF